VCKDQQNLKTVNEMGRVNEQKVSEYDERLQRALKALRAVDNPISVGEAAEEYEGCVLPPPGRRTKYKVE